MSKSDKYILSVVSGYEKLAEDRKKFLCQRLQQSHPDLFANWIRQAGLKAGGFTPTHVAQRKTDIIRKSLDRVIAGQKDPTFILLLLSTFFIETYPRLNDKLKDALQYKEPSAPEQLDEALAAVRQAHQQDQFLDLFEAVARMFVAETSATLDAGPVQTGAAPKPEEKKNPAPPEPEPDVPAVDLPVLDKDRLRREFHQHRAELDNYLHELKQGLDTLGGIHLPEKGSDLPGAFREAVNIVDVIHRDLDQLARQCGLKPPQWSGGDDFGSAVEKFLTEACGIANRRQHESLLKTAMADVLEGLEIRHRSPARCNELRALRDQVVQELRSTPGLALPVMNEAEPADPVEWLKTAWELQGDEYSRLQSELQAHFARLAQLLTDCEWEWLHLPTSVEFARAETRPAEHPAPAEPIPADEDLPGENPGDPEELPEEAAEADPGPPANDADDSNSTVIEAGDAEEDGPAEEGVEEEAAPPEAGIRVETQPEPEAQTPEPEKMEPEAKAEAPADADPGPGGEEPATPTILKTALLENADRQALWDLLSQGRWSLAYHLAEIAAQGDPKDTHLLPGWLVASLAIAPRINHAEGELAQRLGELFLNFRVDTLFATDDEDHDRLWNHQIRFLVAAAAMRPALLAPQTKAGDWLPQLRFKDPLGLLYRFGCDLSKFSKLKFGLDPQTLKHLRDENAWREDMHDVQRNASETQNQGINCTLPYQMSTRIVHDWHAPGGLLQRLLDPVIRNDTRRADEVRREIHKLSYADDYDREILAGQRQHNAGHRDPIVATARRVMHDRIKDCVSIASQWLRLVETQPDQARDFIRENLRDLQDTLRGIGRVIAEIENFLARHTDPNLNTAGQILIQAIGELPRIFDPGLELLNEPSPAWLLNSDLLKLNPHLVEKPLRSVPPLEGLAEPIRELALRPDPPWGQVFENSIAERAFDNSIQIIENLDRPQPVMEAMREFLERELEESRNQLDARLNSLQALAERLVNEGVLKERGRDDIQAQIAAEIQNNQKKQILRFKPAIDYLGSIEQDMLKKRDQMIEQLRARLDAIPDITQEDRQAIQAVMSGENPDLLTAEEYIGLLTEGQPLPQAEKTVDHFTEFFEAAFRPIENFFTERSESLYERLLKIKRNSRIFGVDLARVRQVNLDEGLRLVREWFQSKDASGIQAHRVKRILEFLDLKDPELTNPGMNSGDAPFCFQTRPIQSRAQCPIAVFGSNAEGRYRVLCIFDICTADQIVERVNSAPHSQMATLVFYFGRLSEFEREALARHCRERQSTFLVLDNILLLYLLTQRESRLPAFIHCAAPFTYLTPFHDASGPVPPEMFFGRRAERKAITDQTGGCLVYGGRQIGKTALLASVEEQFHHPDQGQIALFIDLKTQGIGLDRGLDEIWQLIRERLQQIPNGPVLKNVTSRDSLLHVISVWIRERPGRRILLLLDEADRFLSSDAREDFIRCDKFRGLMNETGGAFKVVFAGLHNVLRMTTQGNHPLAQFGSPILIGPMMRGYELHEAREMIRIPFLLAGFRFESEDLITRILSQTSYYPSLIQLYCHELLKHLTFQFSHHGRPRWTISRKQVDRVYDSRDLRDKIRYKFEITLDLDPRYKVIAYLLAYEALSGLKQTLTRGFDTLRLRELAIYWAEELFQDGSAPEHFTTVLDEMVGLGILRRIDDDHYTLRNMNMVRFLGTDKQIESHLLQHHRRTPDYDASSFHAAFRVDAGRVDQLRLNPLSALQQTLLLKHEHGTVVLAGSLAAGLADVEPFLRSGIGEAGIEVLPGKTTAADFRDRLAGLAQRSKEIGSILSILVTPKCPWDMGWVREAQARISHLREKGTVRIIFMADPAILLRLVEDETNPLREYERARGEILNLRPWSEDALNQWLDPERWESHGPTLEIRKQIPELTGRWPGLLYMLRDAWPRSNPPENAEAWLAQLAEQWHQGSSAAALLQSQFSITTRTRAILQPLAELGELTIDEWIEVAEAPLATRNVCLWADRLGYVRCHGENCWSVEPALRQLLIRANRD